MCVYVDMGGMAVCAGGMKRVSHQQCRSKSTTCAVRNFYGDDGADWPSVRDQFRNNIPPCTFKASPPTCCTVRFSGFIVADADVAEATLMPISGRRRGMKIDISVNRGPGTITPFTFYS